MRLPPRRIGRSGVVALVAACISLVGTASAGAVDLDDMTGCWVSEAFDPTSQLLNSTQADSAELIHEKMLLRFKKIAGTDYLAFGHIFEWDKSESYVLGPTYQNGAFNPDGDFLTFGFPDGGLDRVTMLGPDTLLYVHTKASTKSDMSVRRLERLDCGEAAKLEADLLKRQAQLEQGDQ